MLHNNMDKLFLIVILSIVSSATTQGGKPNPPETPVMHDIPNTPVIVEEGHSAVLTCIVRSLGNSSVVWKKWENGKAGPKILTANEIRVTADRRVQVIHDEGGDVWVLAIREAQPVDSGSYICEVNTTPALRSFHNLTVLSVHVVVSGGGSVPPAVPDQDGDFSFGEFRHSYKGQGSIMSHNYTNCCIRQNVSSGCLGFCTLKTILDGTTGEPNACENDFPKIVSCMADGRDHIPCCIREGIPDLCQDLCRGEYTLVTDNVKTHFSCPSHIESTLSCIADGVEILPSEPLDLDTIALSPTSINVSWSIPLRNGDTVTEYIVNVTKLRSFDAPFVGLGYGREDESSGSSSMSSESESDEGAGKRGAAAKGKSPTLVDPAHANDSYIQAHAASRLNRNRSGSPSGVGPLTVPDEPNNAEDKVEARMMQVKVHDDTTWVVIPNLLPFTMYEISVRAFNIHGRSLPSVRLRTLTLAPGVVRPSAASQTLKLPDVKGCCEQNGINSPMCVTKLCDPKMTVELAIPDLMICAVHASPAFTCLANGIDHSPCCRQRGIPEPCTDLCSANFTARLDFHYFKCLRYMPEYRGCVLEGYGVLPSPPRQVRVSNVQEDFAIIHWSSPAKLPASVTGYNLHYRPLSTYEAEYHTIPNVHPPYILEKLYGNAEYEVYVEALNEHGVSQPSQRVVFRTESMHLATAELEEEISNNYNETACCEKAGLSALCLPLCSYDASMSDIRVLALACAPEFHTLLRCAAGGRDHTQCCERRGVGENCLGICSARLPDSLLQMADVCLPYIGNIVQCFEEGTELLPGPVREFHANLITDNSIALSWESPIESNVSHYEVFYQLADPSLGRDSSTQLHSVNVTEPAVELTNLTTNSTYLLSVVAVNQHGSSVPSALIQVTISNNQFNGSRIPGVVSAPHSLVVGSHAATRVQIVWQPPLFAHPTDNITYKVYHRSVRDKEYVTNVTILTSITLEPLNPNSQYIVYVTASTEKGESLPSETLIAWTDPAHSPYVEAPRIQPANLLVEGSTMTVFCVALGDPTPTISLYINGKLVKQLKSRHLTEVVSNVTRDMDIVSCLAENGYGAPMQASRRIHISHAPSVLGADVTLAAIGDKALLECTIFARPEPKVAFWRGQDGVKKTPLVDGGKYAIHLEEPNPAADSKYTYTLKIVNVTEEDGGDYYCQADNPFGDSTKKMSVRTRLVQNESLNVSGCCIRENVSPECIDACNMYLDIESVIDKPECLPEFNKLMKCAADGRDHRPCCATKFVPRPCLDACHGFPIQFGADSCALKHTKSILNCFHENRELIPGPPINVQFKVISENEGLMSWDPPSKNPDAAILYKLFWRRIGDKRSDKIDTQNTFAHVQNLKPGITYEAVVKAVSSHGSSTLTPKILFTTEDNTIAYASTGGSNPGVGVGVTLLVLVIIAAAVGAIWIFRKKQFGLKPISAIAFENPSYIREPNPDASLNGVGDGFLNNGGHSTSQVPSVSNGVTSNGNGWHSEHLHTPRVESEVAPTLYEELRLGSEGAGFRRLK